MFESEISITSVASDCWCIAAPNLLSPIRPGELGAVRFHASSPDRNAKFWQRNLTLTYTVAGTGETHTSPVRLDFSTVDSPAPKGNVVFTHLASDVQTVAVEFNLHRKHKESDFTLEAVTLDGLPIEVDQANWAPSTSSNNPNTLSVIVMVPMLESPDRYFALDFTFATKKGDRVTRSVLLVQNGHRSYSVTPKSIENLDFTVGEKSDVTFAIRHKEGSPFRVLAQDIPKGVEVVSFDDSTPGTLILNLSVSHTEFETAQSVRRQAGIPALSTIERLISLTVSTGDALDSAFITLHASSIIEQLPPPPGSQ
ncbi:MAG: hypothetical protein SF028_15700 [Candidatus Sumerlaeia bacterium]|nr:hypothetical protein [Candidatus Sumerlaeia bacterium]